jgi:hypothetical protein
VFGDPFAHFIVEGLPRGDIDPGRWQRGDQLLGMAALAGARTADDERKMGQIGNDG